ncbi:hypothetical protein F7725_021718 [Dissostichus mawsoni]|uniref:Uncharacterized protein n=1 Tax=Dissostichus mawsoni TaxID=36200 RepID=A0A7J5ZE95_DISMA|nr:hypothetical protein F7725_021718 [Dissostichus mawsoni]
MLYIPVCICLRAAHGMHLWFPSVTIKSIQIPEDKESKDIGYSSVEPRLAVFSDFLLFFSSLK